MKFIDLYNSADSKQEISNVFGESFSARLSEMQCICPNKVYWGTFHFWKIHIFEFFRKMNGKIPVFCQKTSGRVVRTAFYVSREKFWGKKIVMFFYLWFFRIWERLFRTFSRVVSAWLSKLLSPCAKVHFKQILTFLEKWVFKNLSDIEQKETWF